MRFLQKADKGTLSEDNTQIFASKYQMDVLTEDELRQELQPENYVIGV